MALPVTPKPTYPVVPRTPGVPPVLRQIGAIQNRVVLLAADAVSVYNMFQGPQWGLFVSSSNQPAFGGLTDVNIVNALAASVGVQSQSVGGIEFRQDYRISSAPQEDGAFLSYNKVQMPFDARVTYAISGLPFARRVFLERLQFLASSLELLDIIMPEFSYFGCNVIHYDFRRTARHGVTMVLIDIWVEQVRITGTAQFTLTKTPSAASPQVGGQVQPIQTPVPGGAPT